MAASDLSYSQVSDSLNSQSAGIKSYTDDSVMTENLQSMDTIVKKKIQLQNDSLKSELQEVTDSLGNKLKQNAEEVKESIKAKSDSLSGKLKENVTATKDSVGNKIKAGVTKQKEALNAKKDSLAGSIKQKANDQKEALNTAKDSLAGKAKQMVINNYNTVKKQIMSVKPVGTIAAGYEYGVLPFVAGNDYPTGGFKTEGSISLFVAGIPVEFIFCYTTIKQVIGLNNYFRLSYDGSRYKEQLADKLNSKEQLLQNRLGKLKLQQQQLSQKIMFMNYMQKHPNYKIPAKDDLKNKKLSVPKLPQDSLSHADSVRLRKDSLLRQTFVYAFPAEQKDSMSYSSCPFDSAAVLNYSFPAEEKDSMDYYSVKEIHVHTFSGYYLQSQENFMADNFSAKEKKANYLKKRERFESSADSIKDELSAVPENVKKNYAEKKDSITSVLNAYTLKYDSVNMAIEEVKTEIARIKAYQKMPAIPNNPYLSKVQQFLNHVKKLEIGLCHPSNSVFLLNNIPLQGLNFEYEKNNRFISVAYGTTMNNLVYNPHTLSGMLQGARNYYNYFDFGNLDAGRKILAVKGGVGSKDNTHLYAGFLIGKGKADYLFPVADPSAASKETNVVFELDGKYKFSSQLSAELNLGKSSVQEEDLSMEQVKKCINEAFSGYRSYALLARVNASVKKTGTNLTFTTRWIDPYFKSFGLGFLRSDNLRFEIKAEQPITRKIKYTVAYRREEDNLLKLYDYKNTLYSISNSLSLKLTRQFNIRLIYAPLFRTLKTGSETITDKNNISTAVASWAPKSKKVSTQFNLLYSRYVISGDSSDINFENFSYSNLFFFRSGFKTDLNVSWFKNNLSDTLGNDTYLGVAGIGYTTRKQHSFSIAGKMAYKAGIEPQYGFIAKAGLRFYKNICWEAEIEKIIIGDYYNSFDVSEISRFPYLCKTRLILNF